MRIGAFALLVALTRRWSGGCFVDGVTDFIKTCYEVCGYYKPLVRALLNRYIAFLTAHV